ncbi:MAG TPA: hypothetical protein DCP85_04740, partial [Elusimicrobia bacterium]|nr:hypothetical protein [Elusimicrobiota bacterium]
MFAAIAVCAVVRSAGAGTGIFGNDKPNVLIMLDSSGSMADQISALPAYNGAAAYPNAGYVAAGVYRRSGSEFIPYANAVAEVPLAAARTSLSAYGLWFGDINGLPLELFMGNYVNYQSCASCRTQQRKIDIAKRVLNRMVGLITDARFGVVKFANNGAMGSGGAGVVAPIGTAAGDIVTAVNAISPNGYTPLGEALRDEGSYFKGQFGSPAYASPIQSACQLNSTIIISDGLQNGTVDVRTQAGYRFTQDHSTAYSGVQNVVVHAIGFSMDPAERQQALAVLQTAAGNGGGSFFVADDSAQLEQALFALPP